MKKALLAVLLVVGLVVAVVATADASTTYLTRNGGYYSGDGGEFSLTPSSDWSWVLTLYDSKAKIGTDTFETFCVEKTEFVNVPGTYNIAFNDKAVWGSQQDQGGDYISRGTAWLYHEFQAGTLKDYVYTMGTSRAASAAALQETIWWLEDEVTTKPVNTFTTQVLDKFVDEATAKGNNFNGVTREYGVMALNLTYQGGGLAQDQLVCVPEPFTLLFLGACLVGAGVAGRRFKK